MQEYQQLIRVDTVEEDDKIRTQYSINEKQLKRMTMMELYILVNQVEEIAHKIHNHRAEIQEAGTDV